MKRYVKRLLAGTMCILLFFQSSQVISFAAEENTNLAELQLNDEDESSQEILTDHLELSSIEESSEMQRSLETEDSELENLKAQDTSEIESSEIEEILETEETEVEESSKLESLETEGPSEIESLETEKSSEIEESETEETTATEIIENATTESVTETEETSSAEETIISGEFRNISVIFDGYLAIINAEYLLASNADRASFYVVSYDENGTEITNAQVYSSKDGNVDVYNISEFLLYLFRHSPMYPSLALNSL